VFFTLEARITGRFNWTFRVLANPTTGLSDLKISGSPTQTYIKTLLSDGQKISIFKAQECSFFKKDLNTLNSDSRSGIRRIMATFLERKKLWKENCINSTKP